jgi:ATP-dependent DNA helicase DinG
VNSIKDIFGPNGPLATNLPEYEMRNAQVEMALAVEKTINNTGVLLAEAETGTGKTLAYLIPAMFSGLKVIISTGTKNLQEQIFFKDLRFLKETFKSDIKTTYLKGQDNYLCKNRLAGFLTSPKCLAFPSELVSRLSSWADVTATGDRMELAALKDDAPIWKEVCSTRETRIGGKCPFFEDCFVSRARKMAASADIVVVNHHLYFADIATREKGGTLLPFHDVVIFDEAHLIENIATEFFGTKISLYQIERAVKDSVAAVDRAKLSSDHQAAKRKKLAKQAIELSHNFFNLLRDKNQGKTRLDTRELCDEQVSAYHKMDSTLEAFLMSLMALDGTDENIDHCSIRIIDLRRILGTIMDMPEKNYVYWKNTTAKQVILGASPIDVSSQIRNTILLARDAVILTSATLSTAGNFDVFKSRTGVDFEADQISLISPFNFKKQAALYIPQDMPDVNSPQFTDKAADEIIKLVTLSKGGALILCTSLKNMNDIFNRLKEALDFKVLKQGLAPKKSLLEQFFNNENLILVATASFWQGVDIPGNALRLVVIDRLPFSSPSDPVVSARIEYLKAQEINPFMHYQLPLAALALKQGFGRLIRTSSDFGIVAILDNRIITRHYRHVFLNSLPSTTMVNSFSELVNWWLDNDRRQTL